MTKTEDRDKLINLLYHEKQHNPLIAQDGQLSNEMSRMLSQINTESIQLEACARLNSLGSIVKDDNTRKQILEQKLYANALSLKNFIDITGYSSDLQTKRKRKRKEGNKGGGWGDDLYNIHIHYPILRFKTLLLKMTSGVFHEELMSLLYIAKSNFKLIQITFDMILEEESQKTYTWNSLMNMTLNPDLDSFQIVQAANMYHKYDKSKFLHKIKNDAITKLSVKKEIYILNYLTTFGEKERIDRLHVILNHGDNSETLPLDDNVIDPKKRFGNLIFMVTETIDVYMIEDIIEQEGDTFYGVVKYSDSKIFKSYYKFINKRFEKNYKNIKSVIQIVNIDNEKLKLLMVKLLDPNTKTIDVVKTITLKEKEGEQNYIINFQNNQQNIPFRMLIISKFSNRGVIEVQIGNNVNQYILIYPQYGIKFKCIFEHNEYIIIANYDMKDKEFVLNTDYTVGGYMSGGKHGNLFYVVVNEKKYVFKTHGIEFEKERKTHESLRRTLTNQPDKEIENLLCVLESEIADRIERDIKDQTGLSVLAMKTLSDQKEIKKLNPQSVSKICIDLMKCCMFIHRDPTINEVNWNVTYNDEQIMLINLNNNDDESSITNTIIKKYKLKNTNRFDSSRIITIFAFFDVIKYVRDEFKIGKKERIYSKIKAMYYLIQKLRNLNSLIDIDTELNLIISDIMERMYKLIPDRETAIKKLNHNDPDSLASQIITIVGKDDDICDKKIQLTKYIKEAQKHIKIFNVSNSGNKIVFPKSNVTYTYVVMHTNDGNVYLVISEFLYNAFIVESYVSKHGTLCKYFSELPEFKELYPIRSLTGTIYVERKNGKNKNTIYKNDFLLYAVGPYSGRWAHVKESAKRMPYYFEHHFRDIIDVDLGISLDAMNVAIVTRLIQSDNNSCFTQDCFVSQEIEKKINKGGGNHAETWGSVFLCLVVVITASLVGTAV